MSWKGTKKNELASFIAGECVCLRLLKKSARLSELSARRGKSPSAFPDVFWLSA